MGESVRGDFIRTPDQRLRVFVSSTLGELADERRAVARAISAMRLTPVMFESGARPHPPREVYRAYLAQSDVFIGLYWQRYGWIGPGMRISGLQEELELARGLPRLLYVKAPAPDREPRLTELLSGIEQEAVNSYRTFGTPAELGRLVRDDLATLLSERFTTGAGAGSARATAAEPGAAPSGSAPPRGLGALPVDTTSLVGREQAIDEVAGLIGRPGVRLVTLTGPGGIGKTRLAVAVGERLRERFGSRTVFVPLATVTEPERVLARIGRAVGADLTGTGSPLQALVERLGDGRWLLILDNLDHVVDAARDLDELLARCPGVAILATSRTVLRLRAEREYPVPPLPVPTEPATRSVDELAASPAVALFVDRARAVRHDFALTEANAAAVVEICRRLEGLPLAIELAAARTRLLDPDALLRRLATSLDTLGTGPVDLPERQRTLRATVEWSVGLLDEAERSLLEIMAVFVDGWTVQATAQVAGLDDDRALELTEELHRTSLCHLERTAFGPRCRMLETVREFVAERLAARPDVADIQRRHAEHYRALAERAERPLRGAGQREWGERLQVEAGNLAAAVRWHLTHDRSPLPHLFQALWLFWALWEHLGDLRPWVAQLLPAADSLDPQARAELLWTATMVAGNVGDDPTAVAAYERLAPLVEQIEDPYLHAISHVAMAWTAPLVGGADEALREASTSLEQLRQQDEPFWTAHALAAAGTMETIVGRHDDALRHLTEARDRAQRLDNLWLAAWSRQALGYLAVLRGQLREARTLLDEALALALRAHNTRGVTLCLGAFAQLAFAQGDPEQAALLAGAVDGLLRRLGIQLWPMRRQWAAERIAEYRAALGSDRFDQAYAAGCRLNQREAVAAVQHRLPVV
jgi:predicted ATPase